MELRLLWGPGTSVDALAFPPVPLASLFSASASAAPPPASSCLSVTTCVIFESSLRWTSEVDPEMKLGVPVVI